VLQAIFRRNLPLSTAFGGLTRFVPCSLGFFKKPKFFDAFLSVGGLLPEDSILKERLVFFQLIE
jgi:hypothetical protein